MNSSLFSSFLNTHVAKFCAFLVFECCGKHILERPIIVCLESLGIYSLSNGKMGSKNIDLNF